MSITNEPLLLQQRILAHRGRIARATELKHPGWEKYVADERAKLQVAQTAFAELDKVNKSLPLVLTQRPDGQQKMRHLQQQQQRGIILSKKAD